MPKQIEIIPLGSQSDWRITHLFSHYQALPWSLLLDSADSSHADARFDIMVSSPLATIEYRDGKTIVHHQASNERVEHSQDPFSCIQQQMDDYFQGVNLHHTELSELPFLIGAAGYFGYDLGRATESLPNHAQDCYQTADMGVGLYAWSVIHDRDTSQFYLCSLDGIDAPDTQLLKQQLAVSQPVSPLHLTETWQANLSKQQYCQRIDRINQYLRAGDCYQVNFAQRFHAPYQGDEWQAYLTLREQNQAPFSAFMRLDTGSILSISPERFIAVADDKVETKPIKGTRPRDIEAVADEANKQALIESEKDQAENLMIVDLMRNDLSKACVPGTVQVPDLFRIDSFAAVHHMVSKVTGELDPQHNPLSLLRGAFPGGSITGAPKVRAMEIIDELEPHRRNIYCGSMGYIGIRNDMDTSICIRTLLAEQNTLYCWAGGGIVLDSHAEDEYQESLDKVSRILPSLL